MVDRLKREDCFKFASVSFRSALRGSASPSAGGINWAHLTTNRDKKYTCRKMNKNDPAEPGEIPVGYAMFALQKCLDFSMSELSIEDNLETLEKDFAQVQSSIKEWWGQGRRRRRFIRYSEVLVRNEYQSNKIADALMVDKSTYSNWEHQRKVPSCDSDLIIQRFVLALRHVETPQDLQCDDLYGYINAINECRETYCKNKSIKKLPKQVLTVGGFWILFELSKLVGSKKADVVLEGSGINLLVHQANSRARNYGGTEFLCGTTWDSDHARRAVRELVETWGVFWVFVLDNLPTYCWTRLS